MHIVKRIAYILLFRKREVFNVQLIIIKRAKAAMCACSFFIYEINIKEVIKLKKIILRKRAHYFLIKSLQDVYTHEHKYYFFIKCVIYIIK